MIAREQGKLRSLFIKTTHQPKKMTQNTKKIKAQNQKRVQFNIPNDSKKEDKLHKENPTSDVVTPLIPKEKEKLARLEVCNSSSLPNMINVPSFDMAQALNKVKILVSFLELMKVQDHRNVVLSMIANTIRSSSKVNSDNGVNIPIYKENQTHKTQDANMRTPKVYLVTIFDNSPSQVDLSYMTFLINNKLVRNYMLDSRVEINILPLGIMKQLGFWVDVACGKCYAMDNEEIPYFGVIKDLELRFVAHLEVPYRMDVTMDDIPPQYGMLLSRQWGPTLGIICSWISHFL